MAKKIHYKELEMVGAYGVQFLKGVTEGPHRKGEFLCPCGKVFITYMTSVNKGYTKSCGCYSKKRNSERFTKHGLSNTRVYKLCSGVWQRCYNKNNTFYSYYGGRGIKCYWDTVADMAIWIINNLGPGEGLTIDRIDSNGDYRPGNIKWATRKEQSNNTRNNNLITVDGVTKTVTQWAEYLGISIFAFRTRIERGRSISRAMGQPVQKRTSMNDTKPVM